MLSTVLIIVLILLLIGAIPSWGYSRSWGYFPSGILGVVPATSMTVNAIRNAAGVVLPNPEAYWTTDEVYIVPDEDNAEMRVLIAAGVLPTRARGSGRG